MPRAPGDDLHRQLIRATARGAGAACATLLAWGSAAGGTDQGPPPQPENPAEALELPTVTVVGTTYARGDENNADRNGPLPGYALVNLDARARLSGNLELFARVNNVLDARYYDFGILGENFFTGPGESFGPAAGAAPVATQFRGPGAPLGAWVGVRYAFGGTHAPRETDD